MQFKEWLMNEAGHFMMSHPTDLWVIYHGKPTMRKGVTMVDPRFEFMDVPLPALAQDSKFLISSKKFLGQYTFSLPVIDPSGKKVVRWIVVPRKENQMLGGGDKAFVSSQPEGVEAPLDWANHADIMDDSGGRVAVTYGGNVG